jgi:hypothetical protein
MVAKIISGKSISGALNYNEHKVKSGKAEFILAEGFTKDMDRLTYHDKLGQLQQLPGKNTRTLTNAVDISLNFDKEDRLDQEKLGKIACLYMEKIGFGSQPYLIYEHHDAAHRHIHIVSTNIRSDGTRISLHNIGKHQSEKARKEIEKEFGLVRAESKKKNLMEFVRPIDVQRAIYGKSAIRRSISNIVGMVSRTYKYTSLSELNTVLKQYNVTADRGKEGSQMHENKGLIYSLIDENGNKIGIPVKASSIYGKPTLSFLEKQFKLNELLRKPYKNQLKESIDEGFNGNPKGLHDLVKALDKKGVHLAIRENAEGMIYGATFVDNKTKCVFKGSDLGKQYGAKALLERLNAVNPVKKNPEIFRPGYTELIQSERSGGNNTLSFGPETDQILNNRPKGDLPDERLPGQRHQ